MKRSETRTTNQIISSGPLAQMRYCSRKPNTQK